MLRRFEIKMREALQKLNFVISLLTFTSCYICLFVKLLQIEYHNNVIGGSIERNKA